MAVREGCLEVLTDGMFRDADDSQQCLVARWCQMIAGSS